MCLGRGPRYLIGLSCELAPAEFALDFALGAVVLQVFGQVSARQLDGAAVGAGDHVEGAGREVALEKKQISMLCSVHLWCHLFSFRVKYHFNTTTHCKQISAS